MYKLLAMLLLTTVMCQLTVKGQEKVSDINFAHLYDPDEELFLHYRLVNNPENGKLLILEINLNNRSTELSDYTVSFFEAVDYNSPLNQPLQHTDSTYLGSREQAHFLAYSFSRYPPLIIAKVTSKLSGLSYFQDVRTADVHSFMLQDNLGRPVVSPYITTGRYDILSSQPMEITYYDHNFPAARAPMATDRGSVPKTMEVTNTFTLDTAYDHIYEDIGLYVATGVNANSAGESFRVQGSYYPEYVTIPDLVEPLIYISTRAEREKLLSAKDDKKKFDEFWVEMTGSKDKARWIIKNYYEKVSQANAMFTTYKEGWKTDRGMLFILFGHPDQVIRDSESETWTYLPGKRLPPMTYKLITLQSRYADRQYSLIRDKQHENGYLAAARYWREARPLDER